MSSNTYKIQRGDTLSGIASKYNTTVNELMSLNPYIKNANLIYAGNSLNLPTQKTTTQSTVVQQPRQQVTQSVQPMQTTTQKSVNKSVTPTKTTQQLAEEYAKNSIADITKTLLNYQKQSGNNAVIPSSTATTQSIPSKTTQQLAEEYAKSATSNTTNETQALLAQYEKIAEQYKQGLQNQEQQALNQINAQRDTVLNNYNDSARQAYINKMLASKGVAQELSQAGLSTSGLVGSAYANVENAYSNNLANLQSNRDNSIRDIDTQVLNTQLQYDAQENQLLGEIENAKLELQKYGNELANQRYQNAIANYLNFANIDYTKEQDRIAQENYLKEFEYQKEQDRLAQENYLRELARSTYQNSLSNYLNFANADYAKEQDRIAQENYLREFEYQKEQDRLAQENYLKEYELALKKSSSSGSSGSGSGSWLINGTSNNNENDNVKNIGDNSVNNKGNESFINNLATEIRNNYKGLSDEQLATAIDYAAKGANLSDDEIEELIIKIGR